jgi:uncharacterized membrane protein (UPF0127 family)
MTVGLALVALAGLVALALLVAQARAEENAGGEAPETRPTVQIATAAGESVTVFVEVADTVELRSQGLMLRQEMAADAGMLFVFEQDVQVPFWMRNTLLPLSIAFIDASGTIVDIRDMQPLDETLIYSRAPYRYTLEVNQGFFAAHGIAPGDRVELRGQDDA